MTPSTQHGVTYTDYPGTYGERPTPSQRCYECLCGADLGFDEEGRGSIDVQEAFEEHLQEEGLLDPEE